MRSTTSRRLRSCPPHHPSLLEIAHLIDEVTRPEPGHVAVHVADDPDELVLGLAPIEADRHPFTVLAGCAAPATWRAFGLRVVGTAHHLDGEAPSARASTIFVVDRSGAERSLLRQGDALADLPGPASGTIPDLCRRVLGLATEPAPRSTAALWTLGWFDAVLAAWGDPQQRAGLGSSWARIAALHPAVDPDLERVPTPEQLVRLARAHAAAWPWRRLRTAPSGVRLPGSALPADVAAWMDDGFFARWTLGGLPPATELLRDVGGLVDPELRSILLRTAVELLA